MRKWNARLLALAIIGVVAAPSAADIIVQGSGDNYLAFEAEDFQRITGSADGWRVVDTTPTIASSPIGNPVLPGSTNASGSTAVLDDFPDSSEDHESTITYLVKFNAPGTYRMYIRQSLFQSGADDGNYGQEDSYYRPGDWFGSATVTEHSGGPDHEGTYGWRNTSDNYTVHADDAGAPLLVFNLDDRESGYSYDRIVFSQNTGLGGAALDALSNSAKQPVYDPFLYYSFESPDGSGDGQATDFSGHFRDGSLSTTGSGAFTYTTSTAPPELPGTQVLELTESGNNNAGRLTRAISTGELDFDNQSWTFSGWFNRRDTDQHDFIFHLGSGDGFGGGDELYVYAPQNTTDLGLELYASSSKVVDISTTGVNPGTWYHVALLHEAQTGEMSLWLDGVRIGLDTDFALNLSQSAPLVFGGHTAPTFQASRWFDGYLDDLALYDYALNPWQIGTLAGGADAVNATEGTRHP
jgi:hypothetical protein